MVHQLIRVLEADGEGAAAKLVAKLGSEAEVARELAYRLYTICERNKRAPEALSYNGLVQSWPEIMRLSRDRATPQIERHERTASRRHVDVVTVESWNRPSGYFLAYRHSWVPVLAPSAMMLF